jgi:positive regulator of sigma E activity
VNIEDKAVGAAIVGIIVFCIFLICVMPWFVMLLWNWLMPEIFGFKTISFWQAWGLMVLGHLLFDTFYRTSNK